MTSAKAVTDVLKALADPTRRTLLERLNREGEATVVELTAKATISQSAVSQHLAALRRAGLVLERRSGRNTHYRARPQGLAPVVDWIAHQDRFWRERFDNLRQLLKEMEDD